MNKNFDCNGTDHTIRTSTIEPDSKVPLTSEPTGADELSDAELEQVSGGGDGGSTWNPS